MKSFKKVVKRIGSQLSRFKKFLFRRRWLLILVIKIWIKIMSDEDSE